MRSEHRLHARAKSTSVPLRGDRLHRERDASAVSCGYLAVFQWSAREGLHVASGVVWMADSQELTPSAHKPFRAARLPGQVADNSSTMSKHRPDDLVPDTVLAPENANANPLDASNGLHCAGRMASTRVGLEDWGFVSAVPRSDAFHEISTARIESGVPCVLSLRTTPIAAGEIDVARSGNTLGKVSVIAARFSGRLTGLFLVWPIMVVSSR